ncbi:MAG: hypothetical protein HY744_07835 [Deltaproteobacteria bacterium]|nr:hypothetical protein [Deltaproteobacteria bacterium]
MNARIAIVLVLGCAFASLAGCGPDTTAYKPREAYSGQKPSLPSVPNLPNTKKKIGDAYTVFGASHDLRSRVHGSDFQDKPTSIIGYIVKTNMPDAPECAIHKTGKGDPPGCKSAVPAFYIADEKDEKEEIIAVLGWASNFAQVYTMIDAIDRSAAGKEEEAKLADEFWGMDLPNPIPNVGARVKVTGNYGVTFTKATGGAASNPKYGIMTADKIEYLEKPPKLASLPGMKLTKKLY